MTPYNLIVMRKTSQPKESYTRLLLAAMKLRSWNGDAEISKGCASDDAPLDLSASRIGNFRTRGVSKDSLLDLCRIIGCRPLWVRDGTGVMEDVGAGVGDDDITEAINLLSSVRGKQRTKAVAYLEKEVEKLVAERDRTNRVA